MKKRINKILSGYKYRHCESIKKVKNGYSIKIADVHSFFITDVEAEFEDDFLYEHLRAMMGYSFDEEILGRHAEQLSEVYARLTARK